MNAKYQCSNGPSSNATSPLLLLLSLFVWCSISKAKFQIESTHAKVSIGYRRSQVSQIRPWKILIFENYFSKWNPPLRFYSIKMLIQIWKKIYYYYYYYWSGTTHYDNRVTPGAYIAFGQGWGQSDSTLTDVHGAGCQKSDPKYQAPETTNPSYFGPQND